MNRLKELRENKGFSMSQMAKGLNIPYQTYVHYEKGDRGISPDLLLKIADYFDVSVDWLTGKSDFKNNAELAKYYGTWGNSDPYFDAPFDFCDLLAEIREEQGVSVSEMADIIGVTPQDYADCESGVKPITYEQAEKLCEHLGTNTSQVLFDNDYYDEVVPAEYHNDIRKWELLKQQDELDRIVLRLYPDFVKGKNYLPSNRCVDISDYTLLEKYHALDRHGTKIVDIVLDEEYKRCKKLQD